MMKLLMHSVVSKFRVNFSDVFMALFWRACDVIIITSSSIIIISEGV